MVARYRAMFPDVRPCAAVDQATLLSLEILSLLPLLRGKHLANGVYNLPRVPGTCQTIGAAVPCGCGEGDCFRSQTRPTDVGLDAGC